MNYLLTGQEEYLKHQFVEKLKKSILNNSTDLAFDFDIFRGGEKEFTKILDSFNTLPFISKKRLVAIKDIDKLSTKEKKSVLKYLKSPQDSTILVLETSSNNFDKFLEETSKFTKPIKCNRLKEKELDLWIKKEFAVHHKKISPALAGFVRELVGDDLFLLKNEIAKIISFLGDSNEVTERHLEAILRKTTHRTAFDLMGFILGKRVEEALSLVDSLLIKEKPQQILNLLAWQFRKNRNRHARALEIILEADFFIKRGKINARHALERALVSLCGLT